MEPPAGPPLLGHASDSPFASGVGAFRGIASGNPLGTPGDLDPMLMEPMSSMNSYGPTVQMTGSTLQKPMPFGTGNSDVTHNTVNAMIPYNRQIYFLHEFGQIRGTIAQWAPGFLYKGPTQPSSLYANVMPESAYHYASIRNALISPVTANCLLITAAAKAQRGEMNMTYDEYASSMFSYDGIIHSVSGDEEHTSGYQYAGRREAMAVVMKGGPTKVRNVWGTTGLKAGTGLYMMLKQFAPEDLQKLPYNVNPSMGMSSSVYAKNLETLRMGGVDARHRPMGKQWVYQFVPVQPVSTDRNTRFTSEYAYRSRLYKNEDGHYKMAPIFKIGTVAFSQTGSIQDIKSADTFDNLAVPNVLTNASALAGCPTIDVLASGF
jgi:hypothetical protein